MNHHIALTTRRLPSFQSLLNPPQDSEDAGSTCANSEYESPNAHSCSNRDSKPTANTPSISEPRSTVQLSGPGEPMSTIPTAPVGSTPSPGGSSLAKSSQVKNRPFPAINDPRRTPGPEQSRQIPSRYRLPPPTPGPGPRQPALKSNVSSAEASYEHQVLENARLRSMDSQLAIDAARSSPVLKSTAATSHSQPSMASPETHIPSPYAAISPQDVQGIQDPSAHLPDMQSYLGTPPSENVAPPRHEELFQAPKEQYFMTLPGSNDRISVPVDDRGSKKAQERRKRNAVSSRNSREKKKNQQEQLSEAVKQLQMEMKGMEERVWKMEKEQNSCREFIRNLIMQAPWLSHSVQAPDFLPQTSNTVIRMDDFAARPQSYGGGSSLGEQLSKRRRTNQSPRVLDTRIRSFRQSTHRYRV